MSEWVRPELLKGVRVVDHDPFREDAPRRNWLCKVCGHVTAWDSWRSRSEISCDGCKANGWKMRLMQKTQAGGSSF